MRTLPGVGTPTRGATAATCGARRTSRDAAIAIEGAAEATRQADAGEQAAGGALSADQEEAGERKKEAGTQSGPRPRCAAGARESGSHDSGPGGCLPRLPRADKTVHVQYQTDIPPVQPIVTAFQVEVGHCPCCGKRVQGQHPEQTSQALGAANHTLGPRTVALAADFKYRLGIPFRKIADLFGGAFGLPCCAGGLTRTTSRLATAGRGMLEILKLQLPGRFVVHADETSWWINGMKAWLHAFASDDLVVFQVGDRSRNIAREILGPNFRGFVSCDGYAGYDAFATARCNAHPLRRIRDLLAAEAADATALETIQGLLQGGLTLRDRREELTELGYRRLVSGHKAQVHDWIVEHAAHADPAVGRLARHLGRYETEFLRYLDDPRIPATNNLGESTLRFAVILRKIGCCNRTPRGVKTFEVLSSVLATFRKRGLDFTRWVIEFLQGTSPKYVPPDLLPAGFDQKIILRA
jgi:hypothetical protein